MTHLTNITESATPCADAPRDSAPKASRWENDTSGDTLLLAAGLFIDVQNLFNR